MPYPATRKLSCVSWHELYIYCFQQSFQSHMHSLQPNFPTHINPTHYLQLTFRLVIDIILIYFTFGWKDSIFSWQCFGNLYSFCITNWLVHSYCNIGGRSSVVRKWGQNFPSCLLQHGSLVLTSNLPIFICFWASISYCGSNFSWMHSVIFHKIPLLLWFQKATIFPKLFVDSTLII